MKKVYLLAAVAMMAAQLQAQNVILDTYVGAQLATEDLNGTARYVGMGGAMEALGADLSTMSTNPAGIGLFRRAQVAGSFGLVSQSEGKSFQDGSKTNASFDQLGAVFSTRTGMHSYVNFGVNFHKSRNFCRQQPAPLMARRRTGRPVSRAFVATWIPAMVRARWTTSMTR